MSQNESHGNKAAEVDLVRKRGVLRGALKKLSLFLLGVIFLSSVGFEYIYFYFPKDKAKRILLSQLQKKFHIKLQFDGLNFNPFKGLELTDVSLMGPGELEIPMFKLDKVLFEMEFWDLFFGKVTIRRAVVEKAFISLERRDGRWNFERLLDVFHRASTTPAPETSLTTVDAAGKTSSYFALPMEIQLEEFSLLNLNVSCSDEDRMHASIDNINLNCKLKFAKGTTTASALLSITPLNTDTKNLSFLLSEPKKIALTSGLYVKLSLKTIALNKLLLSGKLSLGNGVIGFDKRKDTIQLSSAISTTIDLATGNLLLQSLDIASENIIWLKMDGEAKNVLDSPSFVLNIEGASVLESAFRKFREVLPLRRAAGSILISGVRIKGGENLSFKGNITASNLSLEKDDGASISGTKITFNLVNAEVSTKKIHSLDLRIEQETDNIDLPAIKIKSKTDHLHVEHFKQTANIKIQNGNSTHLNYGIFVKGGKFGNSGNLSKLKLSLDVKATGANLFRPENMSGELSVQCDDMSLTPVKLRGSVSTIAFDLRDGHIRRIGADIDVDIDDITYMNSGIDVISLPLKLKTSFITNITQEKEKYTLRDIPKIKSHIDVGVLIADLNITKSLNENFSLLLSVKSNFEKLVQFLPPALSAKLGKINLHGSLVSDTKITGKLKKDYRNSLLNISEDLQIVGLSCELPKKKVYLKPSELYLHVLSNYRVGDKNISGKIRGDVSIGAATLPNLSVSSIQTSFQASAEETIYNASSRINGNVIALKFLPNQLISKPERQETEFTSPINLAFALKMKHELKKGSITLDKLKVEIPSLLLLETKGMLGKWGESFSIDTSLSVESIHSLYSILPEWFRHDIPITRPEGELNMSINADYNGGRGVKLKFITNADKLSIAKEGFFSFSGLKTNISLEKNIVFVGASAGDDKSIPLESKKTPASQKLESENSYKKSSLFLQSFSLDNLLFEDISLGFYFKNDHMSIEHFAFNVLGGSVDGRLFSSVKNSDVSSKVKLKFSGINLNNIIQGEDKLQGDAEIAGEAIGSIGKNNDEPIDMSLLNLDIVITHIGQDAMNRLLFFIDPSEDNPNMVSARRHLKYEAPLRLVMELQRGNLTLTLQLKPSVLSDKGSTLEILREIPILHLKNFGIFKGNVEKIKSVLDILGIALINRVYVGKGGNRLIPKFVEKSLKLLE